MALVDSVFRRMKQGLWSAGPGAQQHGSSTVWSRKCQQISTNVRHGFPSWRLYIPAFRPTNRARPERFQLTTVWPIFLINDKLPNRPFKSPYSVYNLVSALQLSPAPRETQPDVRSYISISSNFNKSKPEELSLIRYFQPRVWVFFVVFLFSSVCHFKRMSVALTDRITPCSAPTPVCAGKRLSVQPDVS